MNKLYSDAVIKWGHLVGFILTAFLMSAALYFEHYMFLDPCPLCVSQRIATILTGVFFLSSFISFNKNERIYKISLTLLLSSIVFGLYLTTKHVYIQGLPPELVPVCGPGLAYLSNILPLWELISVMLSGDGNCAEITWSFWGQTMPWWLRVWFVGFAVGWVLAVINLLKKEREPKAKPRT